MKINHELEFIKSLTWKNVFDSWEKNEADLDHWIQHYRKKGFDSWCDWRTKTVKDLNPSGLQWGLYNIVDPFVSVPKFYGGPFRAWIKNIYNNSNILIFSEIIKNRQIKINIKMEKILDNFPTNNFLVGIVFKNDVVIIEGMHRCCAITLAASRNQLLKTSISIALANFNENKIPLLGKSDSPT